MAIMQLSGLNFILATENCLASLKHLALIVKRNSRSCTRICYLIIFQPVMLHIYKVFENVPHIFSGLLFIALSAAAQ